MPLIRARTVTTEERASAAEPTRLSTWKPYQVTHSERRPALEARRTLFNLVPCNRALEVAMTQFADRASDVAAFAKNAGSQCLPIDYLGPGSRLAFYTPDFFIRTIEGNYYLVETKGREDRDVPIKARAAIAWCESASTSQRRWEYLYVSQGVFERMRGDTIAQLVSTCQPALRNLLEYEETQARYPLFAAIADQEEKAPSVAEVIDESLLDGLPSRHRKAVEQAVMLFQFFSNKEGMNYAPVFNPTLTAAADMIVINWTDQCLRGVGENTHVRIR